VHFKSDLPGQAHDGAEPNDEQKEALRNLHAAELESGMAVARKQRRIFSHLSHCSFLQDASENEHRGLGSSKCVGTLNMDVIKKVPT
jgi:hypothetical protein